MESKSPRRRSMYSVHSPFFGSITFTPNDTLRERLAHSGIRPEEIHHILGQLGLAVVRECELRETGSDPAITP